MTLAVDLAAAGTATIGEAWQSARIMDAPPRPLVPEMVAAGIAVTVRCKAGDNLALHQAIANAPLGDTVLVADYEGCLSSGPFGEIMALACQMRGIVGLIIDGAVRDSVQIANLGFPVFSRGLSIRGTTKTDNGSHGLAVEIGGVVIESGEMIVADADGIVVFPFHEAANVRNAAQSRIAAEAKVMARIRAGETTTQIYQI